MLNARPGFTYEMNGPPCRMCARGDCPWCTKLHRDQRQNKMAIVPPAKAEQWLLCPHCDQLPVPPLQEIKA
jgi:hypothetical protein